MAGSVSTAASTAGGINSRLDELQAAVLRVRLSRLDRWNELRRERAAWYRELLGDVPRVVLPEDDAAHVYHLFVVQVTGGRRDALREALAARGVGSDVHYPLPTHLEPAWEDLGYEAGELPVTERLAETVLSLPCFPELTRAEVEYVASCVRESTFLTQRRKGAKIITSQHAPDEWYKSVEDAK